MTLAAMSIDDVPSIERVRRIIFQEGDKRYADVQVQERECSCGVPSCKHLWAVRDLVDLHGHEHFDLFIQKLTTAIAEGRAEDAQRWGRLMLLTFGPYYLKRYMMAECLRHTRNVELYLALQRVGTKDIENHLNTFLASRRFPELPIFDVVSKTAMVAYSNAEKLHTGEIDPAQIITYSSELETLLTAVFVNKTLPEQKAFKAALRLRSGKVGDAAYQLSRSKWSGEAVPRVLAEMIAGYWKPEFCQTRKISPLTDPWVIFPRQ